MEPKDSKTAALEEKQAAELLKVKIADIKSGKYIPKGIADIRIMEEVINNTGSEKSLFDRLFDRVFPATEEDAERKPQGEEEGDGEPKNMDWESQEKTYEDAPKEVPTEKQAPADMVRSMKYKQATGE